eukprot:3027483-Rhodomonas_salina.1
MPHHRISTRFLAPCEAMAGADALQRALTCSGCGASRLRCGGGGHAVRTTRSWAPTRTYAR